MKWEFIKKTYVTFLLLAAFLFYVTYFFYRLQERIEQKEIFSIFFRTILILAFSVQLPDLLRKIRINIKKYL